MTTSGLPTELLERLRSIRSVGAITGAGVSRGAGIPTYRGQGGIYDDPDEGNRTVEALSAPTLVTDPDRTWRALAKLARAARGARPAPAHRALADIEARVERCVILTQNVDGLHGQAGSRSVIEIHGSIRATRCTRCGLNGTLAPDRLATLTAAPTCGACAGVLRPGVVLFGELLPEDAVERMLDAFHRRPPELVLIAGTSAMFPYISEPLETARAAGKLTVEINPERTAASGLVDFHLTGEADRFLPLIAAAITRAERPESGRSQ